MGTKKDNLKSLFSNTRSRVIILFTAALLIVGVGIGYFKLKGVGTTGSDLSTSLRSSPGQIQSIPGSDPTEQYAELQTQQNIEQARQAAKTGNSAIPTIIKTQSLAEGAGVVGFQPGEGGLGFQGLARQQEGGLQKDQWMTTLKESNCSQSSMTNVMTEGASLEVLRQVCNCAQLRDNGLALGEIKSVCPCKDLRTAGFTALDFKKAGYSAKDLRACGFNACELKAAGFTAQQMKDAGFSDGELRGAGFSDKEIKEASGLPAGISADDVRKAGCNVQSLKNLRSRGVSASAVRRISGCSAEQLKAAGYTAKELADAGFSAAELKKAGFSPAELKAAGFKPEELLPASFIPEALKQAGMTPSTLPAEGGKADCSQAYLQKAGAAGMSAATIKETLGCSASDLKQAGFSAKDLKDAGYTAAELKNAGFSPQDLKAAGFSAKELKDAGFSAADLKNAGFTPAELKDAGFSAKALKDAGFSAKDLKEAGFSPQELKEAGFSAKDLKAAGFSPKELKEAGFSAGELKDAGFGAADLKGAGFSDRDIANAGYAANELQNAGVSIPRSSVAGLGQPGQTGMVPSSMSAFPSFGANAANKQADDSQRQLQELIKKQAEERDEQRYQQQIQQRRTDMTSAASEVLQEWKKVTAQSYVAGQDETDKKSASAEGSQQGLIAGASSSEVAQVGSNQNPQQSVLKAGDIVFAVLDTSVNSDEPGPILATIVSDRLKGSKLIGSFNMPANSEKMVISFNTLSVPGKPRTISIAAYAIDPNTARTALSSRTDHHYLERYGSLFASSFLEGFGNAFQSANTTVTIGGTGGGDNVTVSNGVGRSALENAVIGLATVGKSWGQQVQQLFNRPITVEVYSGTGMGILFTQDLTSL